MQIRGDGGEWLLVPFALAKEIEIGTASAEPDTRSVRVQFFDQSQHSGIVSGLTKIYGDTSRGRIELTLSNVAKISRSTPEAFVPNRKNGALADLTLSNGKRFDGILVWRFYEVPSGYINVSASEYFETKLWLRVKEGAAIAVRPFEFAELRRISFRTVQDETQVEIVRRSGEHFIGTLSTERRESWESVTGLTDKGYLVVPVKNVSSLEFR